MNTIEEKVKSIANYFDWDETSEQAHVLRRSLLSLYNQGRLDALGEVEEATNTVISKLYGNPRGEKMMYVSDVLSHIASLKEKIK